MVYSVFPADATSTVTITFIDPDGTDVVMADLPTEGSVLWPGMVVDAAGAAADWPGWTLGSDGTWVAGDEFDWARPTVDVRFEYAGDVVEAVEYPVATEDCAVDGGVDGSTADPSPLVMAPDTSTAPGVERSTDPALPVIVVAGVLLAGLVLQRRAVRESGCRALTDRSRRRIGLRRRQATCRAATMRRTRPARPSSARARCRARRA
jgi:hypothetical protein